MSSLPRRPTALAALLLIVFAAHARAASDLGIVVLHGKSGFPADKVVGPFQRALASAGYTIQAPQMCWSRNRSYDEAFPECLHDIDGAIAALRSAGARRIVVAGESLGGAAALVFASHHPELAGVIALAPAGQPALLDRNPQVRRSVTEARQMAATGRGSLRASFTDANVGQTFTVTTTPVILLSFLEPGGPADFAAVLPRIRTPVLWVAGSQDRSQSEAPALFATLASNPFNRLVQVNATHLGTSEAGAAASLDWLRALPAS